MVPNLVARLNLKLVEPVIQTNFWSFLDHLLPIRFYKATYFKDSESNKNNLKKSRMSFGRKRNMSERWLRKNTPGTGKRGRLTDQDGPGRTRADHHRLINFCRIEKNPETSREERK